MLSVCLYLLLHTHSISLTCTTSSTLADSSSPLVNGPIESSPTISLLYFLTVIFISGFFGLVSLLGLVSRLGLGLAEFLGDGECFLLMVFFKLSLARICTRLTFFLVPIPLNILSILSSCSFPCNFAKTYRVYFSNYSSLPFQFWKLISLFLF